MARQDHREFHDLCKKLLSFEPNSRVTAAKAVEHEFFHLDITPEHIKEVKSVLKDKSAPSTNGESKAGCGKSSTNHSVVVALGAWDCGSNEYSDRFYHILFFFSMSILVTFSFDVFLS